MKMKFVFSIVLLMLFGILHGCKKKSILEEEVIKETIENLEAPPKDDASVIEKVKDIRLSISYTVTQDAILPSTFKDTVIKAQGFLTMVFSSKDFRDELYKRNFHDSAYSKTTSNCFNRVYGSNMSGRSIAGKSVYDNLLPNATFSMSINIRKNGDNVLTMGSASACGTRITTNDYWLKITEKKLAYRLARHWAHEYTHIKGYRHGTAVLAPYSWSSSDVDRDPAAGVGDVVGIVLDKWLKEGIIK